MPRIPSSPHGDARETTHVSCVDAFGLVVSMTHSLGIPSGVIVPGTGFILKVPMAGLAWRDQGYAMRATVWGFTNMPGALTFYSARTLETTEIA